MASVADTALNHHSLTIVEKGDLVLLDMGSNGIDNLYYVIVQAQLQSFAISNKQWMCPYMDVSLLPSHTSFMYSSVL